MAARQGQNGPSGPALRWRVLRCRSFAKPFFRTGRGWYVQLGKQQIKLADGPEERRTPRLPPVTATTRIMAERGRRSLPSRRLSSHYRLSSEILDKYLDWCQKHRAARTYEWYRDHIQSFLDHSVAAATMPVADLKPFHVIEWADSHPDWSNAYRRGAIVAIQRPFNWAEELGYIAASPIKKIKKPQPQRRDSHVTPEDFAPVARPLRRGRPVPRPAGIRLAFRLPAAGGRQIEARHVHLEAECIVIPKEESKGKRRPRVILLHGPALEIIRQLVQIYPKGKLFRNEDGNPWKRFAIANRFDRLMLALGIEALKEAGIDDSAAAAIQPPEISPTRRSLAAARKEHQQKAPRATEADSEAGPAAREETGRLRSAPWFCPADAGKRHKSPGRGRAHGAFNGKMVAETYSHMNRATAHLKEALKKADSDA